MRDSLQYVHIIQAALAVMKLNMTLAKDSTAEIRTRDFWMLPISSMAVRA